MLVTETYSWGAVTVPYSASRQYHESEAERIFRAYMDILAPWQTQLDGDPIPKEIYDYADKAVSDKYVDLQQLMADQGYTVQAKPNWGIDGVRPYTGEKPYGAVTSMEACTWTEGAIVLDREGVVAYDGSRATIYHVFSLAFDDERVFKIIDHDSRGVKTCPIEK
jgi:hypothetical protein